MEAEDVTPEKILPIAGVALILVAALVYFVWSTPMTPEQAFQAQYPESHIVESRIVEGYQLVLHSRGEGQEVIASVLVSRLIGWEHLDSGPAATPADDELVRWASLTLGQLSTPRVAVYGYVTTVQDVRVVRFGDYEVEILSEPYFLRILPEGTPAPTAENVVVERYEFAD